MPRKIIYSRDYIEKKFLSLVDIKGSDDCWLWKASKIKGYGFFSGNGVNTLAHIFSYSMYNKINIPKTVKGRKILVRHKCANRSCVNPRHLILGTYTDNNNDRYKKENE